MRESGNACSRDGCATKLTRQPCSADVPPAPPHLVRRVPGTITAEDAVKMTFIHENLGWHLGLFAVLVVISPVVSAQSSEEMDTPPPGPIVTDRPTHSASPVLLPPRTFQLEAGYKFSRDDDGSDSTDAQVLPNLLARYGINQAVEARLVISSLNIKRSADDKTTGLSDITLGAKIALAAESGARPQMALLVGASLPVGHDDFTSDYVIPKILFLGANSLSDRLGLTYNVGPSFVTNKSDGKSDTNIDLNYAVALSGSVGGGFNLFGEIYGAFAFGRSQLDRHGFQAGTTILLSPLFQIDFRAGIGQSDNENGWLVGAGLAFRVPH